MTAIAVRASGLLTPHGRDVLTSPFVRWTALLTCAGWLLLRQRAMSGIPGLCGGTGVQAFAAGLRWNAATIRPALMALDWIVMLAATMPPLVFAMARHVAERAAPSRRCRSVVLFLIGWAGPWMLIGVPVSIATIAVGTASGAAGLAWAVGPAGCAAAALLRLRGKAVRALNRCHGTVAMRTRGAGADIDALRFGLLHGRRCVGACWAPMVLPMLGGMQSGALAAVAAVLWLERIERRPRLGASAMLLCLSAPLTLAAGPHASLTGLS